MYFGVEDRHTRRFVNAMVTAEKKVKTSNVFPILTAFFVNFIGGFF